MRCHWLKIVAALLFLDALIAVWWWRRWREHRFDAVISSSAHRYGMAPSLVKAVVWRESGFNPDARGRVGELGLMQIGEAAAFEWASFEKLRAFEPVFLLDPLTNTRVGSWYLQKLLKRYRNTDDPVPFALADYNAGRSNVLRWIKGAAATNSAVFRQQIDFPGTVRYIDTITRQQQVFQDDFGRLSARK